MKTFFSLALAALVTLGVTTTVVSGCRRSDAGSDAPASAATGKTGETAGTRPVSKYPVVILEPPGEPRAAVTVELARTAQQIQLGLMHRRSLPKDHGMLFLMGVERIHSFWMRNTLIPLDMIFIAKDMTVAGVVENTTPLTDDSRTVGEPSFYVLEVNGGWARKNHVQAGTPVRFKNIP
jgi:hypothetical protein